jgi:hypothetical protein
MVLVAERGDALRSFLSCGCKVVTVEDGLLRLDAFVAADAFVVAEFKWSREDDINSRVKGRRRNRIKSSKIARLFSGGKSYGSQAASKYFEATPRVC